MVLADLSAGCAARTEALTGKYRDRPMDLADATLVALAEERGWKIFTLDEDFDVYRRRGRGRFELIPGR